jgi:deoxyguanosine kinase
MERYPYIGFEGPIAAGKTTIATLFAQHWNFDLVLEDPGENEFLADFYKNKQRWALPMQLWFLAARQKQVPMLELPRVATVVADYTTAKNDVFARLLLKGRELCLYNNIVAGFGGKLPQPDLVVYLNATNEILLNRITGRNREYEKLIDSGYLDQLRDAYELNFAENRELNVLRYDTSCLNLTSEAQLTKLYDAIIEAIP